MLGHGIKTAYYCVDKLPCITKGPLTRDKVSHKVYEGIAAIQQERSKAFAYACVFVSRLKCREWPVTRQLSVEHRRFTVNKILFATDTRRISSLRRPK